MALKFRKGCPQGQYGELLLFNFIQHFFKAAPLLRKMPITTNPGLERHGADAIHYLDNGDEQIFFWVNQNAMNQNINLMKQWLHL